MSLMFSMYHILYTYSYSFEHTLLGKINVEQRRKRQEEWKNEKDKKASRHGQSSEICGGLEKRSAVVGQILLTCRKMERLISTDLMARFMCSELMRTLKFSAVHIMTLVICKSSAVCFVTIPLSLFLCFHMWNAVDEAIALCELSLNTGMTVYTEDICELAEMFYILHSTMSKQRRAGY